MFLVVIPAGLSEPLEDAGTGRWVFFRADPRPRSDPFPVAEVEFVVAVPVPEWVAGSPGVVPRVLARFQHAPARYGAFRSELDVPLDWEILDGAAEVWDDWESFMRWG